MSNELRKLHAENSLLPKAERNSSSDIMRCAAETYRTSTATPPPQAAEHPRITGGFGRLRLSRKHAFARLWADLHVEQGSMSSKRHLEQQYGKLPHGKKLSFIESVESFQQSHVPAADKRYAAAKVLLSSSNVVPEICSGSDVPEICSSESLVEQQQQIRSSESAQDEFSTPEKEGQVTPGLQFRLEGLCAHAERAGCNGVYGQLGKKIGHLGLHAFLWRLNTKVGVIALHPIINFDTLLSFLIVLYRFVCLESLDIFIICHSFPFRFVPFCSLLFFCVLLRSVAFRSRCG